MALGNQHRTERVNFEGKKRVGEMKEEATREGNSIFSDSYQQLKQHLKKCN